MRPTPLVVRTILSLIVVVAAVVLAEFAIEDAVTKALLGQHSPEIAAEKWIDLIVTAGAILFVVGGAVVFQTRANRAVETLRSQNQIIDHLTEAVVATDVEGHIQRWNKGAESLFGYSADEVIGLHASRLFDISSEEMEHQFAEPLRRHGRLEFSRKMILKSGERFDGRLRASVIRDFDENIIGFVSYIIDVTDRLRAEEDLRKSEHFLAEAQRLAHVGTWDWRPNTNVLWWSDEVYRLFGTKPQSYPGSYEKFMEFVHPDDKSQVRDFLRSIPGLKRRTAIDYRIVRPDGEIRHIQGRAEPFYDSDDKFVGTTGTVMDITDRMHVQELLQNDRDDLERRVEARAGELKITLETMVEGVITIDSRGTIEAFNLAAEEIFGYTSDEVIGENVSLLMSRDDAQSHDQYLKNYLQTGAAQIIGVGREVVGRRKNGSTFPLWLGIGEMRIAGETKFVGTVHDITERKTAERDMIKAKEEAEAANNAKSEFLSSMSHELRTPMNAVLGFAQLLEADPKTPLLGHQGDYVDEILRSGHHMVDLIDSVLDLESIERGKLNLNLISCQVGPLIEQCLSLVDADARTHEVSVNYQPSGHDLPEIIADQQHLRQAILHLISNAIKYNRANGSATISCDVTLPSALRISVSDTGSGIPDLLKDKVFEPFERLGQENSNILGAGIGLSVTRRLIENMGGNVGFENREGEGSTFWLELPLAEPGTVDSPQLNN